MFEEGVKYNGPIPQIKYLPTHMIEHSGDAGEVRHVSDEVAKNMDFSTPVQATAFRYGRNHDEFEPSVNISDGHHRLAAAKQTGRPHLPVEIIARNAKGEKLNAMKALSDEIEKKLAHKADGGDVDGITAYHGSPHDFDEFDTSKIGTGEGAQAYGHGLYFAEHEPVAKGYRDQLSGHSYKLKTTGEDISQKFGSDVANIFEQSDGGRGEIGNTLGRLRNNVSRGLHEAGVSKLSDLNETHNPLFVKDIKDTHDRAERLAALLRSGDVELSKGHMYEVHINAHPHHMLDWDKPFREQSEHVRRALDINGIADVERHGHKTGEQIYNMLRGKRFIIDNPEQYKSESASNNLSRAGIKGIKYLDAGSRGDKAEPTHNYVVFDHNDVHVKRKYEQGGAVDNDVIPHGDPKREQNLAKHMEGSKTPPVLYHGTHGDITQFKRTKGAHFGFHFGDIEAANTRLEDLADKHPWDKADLDERRAISEGHFKNLSNYENALRRKNTEVPIDELTKALEAGEDIGPIFKKYEYVPTEEEQAQLGRLRQTYKSSQLPIIKTGKGANVGAYHVAIKNPLRMRDVGNWGSLKKIKEGLPFHSNAKTHGELIDHLKSRGYDGIVYQNNVETPVMKTDSYIAFDPHQIKSATGNNGNFDPSNPDITKADGGEVDDHYIGEHYQDGGEVDPPKKKVKAYKLFRTDPKKPGKLFPLFVDANTPVPIKKWVEAKAGDPGKDPTKVKSKLGDLAYRPGWHAGDLPVATHIGGKSSSDLKAPDYRPDNHVWAEIEMPNDVDWQSEANSRVQYTKAGKPKPATAHITDQVPLGGHYRYKTNPNMTGNWLIGGSMKVNRILKDDEVKAINDANGVADLPRLPRAPETKARGGPIATSGPIVKRALELLSKDRTGR